MLASAAPARNPQPRARAEVLSNGQILLNGKRTGCSIRGAVLVREASEATHLLRKPAAAWAYNVEIVDAARMHGCKGLVVHAGDTGRTYHASMADFTAKGESFDRGYGQQYSLALRYWSKDEAPTAPAAPVARETQPDLQLGLFGGDR